MNPKLQDFISCQIYIKWILDTSGSSILININYTSVDKGKGKWE